MYGDQDRYTKPVYTKLKAGESSMLAEVPSAGAVWSVRYTPALSRDFSDIFLPPFWSGDTMESIK